MPSPMIEKLKSEYATSPVGKRHSDQAVQISWCTSTSEIAEQLWDECFKFPYEGRWWYETLERCGIEDQFRFFYALISKDGKAIGIAPCFVNDMSMDLVAPEAVLGVINFIGKFYPRAKVQRTLFIGSPCADEGTIGILPGYELSEILDPLFTACLILGKEQKCDLVTFKDFADEHCEPLKSLSAKRDLFEVTSYPGTMIKIPAKGLEEYYKELKGSRRHNLKKKLRRSHERLILKTSVEQDPDKKTLDEIFGLFMQTYEKGKTKFEKLNPQFFQLIAKENVAHFVLLKDENTDKLVAFMLCFKLGDRVINKFIGLDYALDPDYFLYFRLFEVAFRWAIDQDAKEFQSGQTGYRAKIDVGHSLVPLTNYAKHLNPVIHKIYGRVSESITLQSLDEDLAVYLKAHPDPQTEKVS